MSKVIQQNPDGSMIVEDDVPPMEQSFNIQTGIAGEPTPTTQVPKRYLIKRNLETGTFDVEPLDPTSTPSPVTPAEQAASAPPVDASQYTMPQVAPPVAPTQPKMAIKTQQKVEQNVPEAARQDVLAGLNTAQSQQLKGLEISAEAGAKKAAEDMGVYAGQLQEQEKMFALEQAKEGERRTRLDNAGKQLQSSLDDIATTKVDPNRFYARMDTGSQIAAGLAIGLGAMGQAMMGTAENPAMQAISRAIDRDIEAQKMDLERKRGVATVASSLYSQMREQFHDERSATAATQAAMLKLVDMKLQNIAASTKNQELAGAAMTMSGKINEDINVKKGAVLKELHDKITIESTAAPADASKLRGEILDTIKGHPQLKDYAEAREGLREFSLATKSGTLGTGVISFVAKGLKQGSFGPEMLNMLGWQSVPDRVEEALKRTIGDVNSPMARKLQTFLVAKEASMRADLGGIFEQLDRRAKEAGETGLGSFMAIGPIGSSSQLSGMVQGRKRVGETPQR